MEKKGLKLMLMLTLVAVVFTCSSTAFAFKARDQKTGLDAKEFRVDELYITQEPVPIYQALNQLSNSAVWKDFLGKNAGIAYIDPRSGRPALLTHVIPLIPGTGENNHITLDSLTNALGYKVDKVTESVMRDLALKFITQYSDLLKINPKEVGQINAINTDGDFIWHIHIYRQINGIAVRSSRMVITINHGNVVVWGTENWNDVNLNLNPSITKDQALNAAFNYVGARLANDKIGKGPHLEIIPVNPNWNGAMGKGLDYILAWIFNFQREGYPNNWEMIVDAHSGKLLSMRDTNDYVIKKIVGQAYPLSNDGCSPQGVSTSTPMSYTDTGQASPNNYTDFGGKFDCTGSSATTTLSGRYVDITDTCGAVSESSTSGCGDIDMLGVSGNHDCTIPTGHSAGDTMASKAAGAEVPQINRQAAGYVNYGYLNSAITCTVNINSTCNAYYNGTINFYRAGGGCGNTGEIAAVFDHEWSHGIDSNDGGGMASPGEVEADILATLRLHTSCTGEGFFVTLDRGCGQWTCPSSGSLNGYNCAGYGDCCTSCTGIRDADYAKHTSGVAHTPVNYICVRCGSGSGPCGKEVHCENAPAAEAEWDLEARDLQAAPYNYDRQTAFEVSTRTMYLGSAPLTAWYTCNCSNNTSGGCSATNGYMGFIGADDDDGNVNNGTPHMTAIYNAFNRHGIACAAPTPTRSGCSGGPTAAATLTGTPQNNSVALSWTAVTGASTYNVFRGEGPIGANCDIGKQKIANVATTSYTDNQALNGRTYYYQVQAVGSNAACLGAMSNCITAIPVPCTSCCAPSTAVLVGNPSGGDGDVYMDNCETATIQVTVSNVGSGVANNCQLTVSPISNFYNVTTAMPINLGNIAVGGTANANVSVDIGKSANKATCKLNGILQASSIATGQTSAYVSQFSYINEVDNVTGNKTYTFEPAVGYEGWTVQGGTWNLSTARVNPGGSTQSVHSSQALNLQCDYFLSPPFTGTATSAVSIPNWYDTEINNGTYWYDRANVWGLQGTTYTLLTPTSGKAYSTGTYYNWTYCSEGTNPGWCGAGTSQAWGPSAFSLSAYNGQQFQLQVRYMTDDLTSGEGVYVDDIAFTNVVYQACDAQSDTCAGSNPPGKVLNNLKITKSGTNLSLTWTAPGGTCTTTGYGLYRGTLPWTAFNHASVSCAITAPPATTPQDVGSYYYLIVPLNTTNEGSYGTQSSGTERPQGSSPCHAQSLTAC